MANTYSQIYIHAVFAVKYRRALIPKSLSEDLYRYMAGIIKSENQLPIIIGGMPDHIHTAFAIKPSMAVSDLMRIVKTNSSKWINELNILDQKFEWQRGFGAFSCSQAHLRNVIRYIANQEHHHKKQSFKKEYLELLKNYEVDYKTEYLFEWILEN